MRETGRLGSFLLELITAGQSQLCAMAEQHLLPRHGRSVAVTPYLDREYFKWCTRWAWDGKGEKPVAQKFPAGLSKFLPFLLSPKY